MTLHGKMTLIALQIACFCFVISDSQAHEIVDPLITVNFSNVSVLELSQFLTIKENYDSYSESNIRLSWVKELKETRFSISMENEPVSVLFRKLREKYHVCTYQATHPLLVNTFTVQPCEMVNDMCQFGASKPIPSPGVIQLEDGSNVRERTGAFLCGGPKYKAMLENGATFRKE